VAEKAIGVNRATDWKTLFPPLVGGLLAIFASVATQLYQSRGANVRLQQDLALSEQQEAAVALKEAGAALEAPLARTRLVLDAIKEDKPDSTVNRLQCQFIAAYETWQTDRNRARVLLAVYFGDSARTLLDSIDSHLVEIARALPMNVRGLRNARDRRRDPWLGTVPESVVVTYRHIAAEDQRVRERLIQSLGEEFRLLDELWFTYQMVLASNIEVGRVSSFHPWAKYAMDPSRSRRFMDSLGREEDSAYARLVRDYRR